MSSPWLILLLLMRGASPWRPCTDLLPLDLLSHVTSRNSALKAVHVLQDGENGSGINFSDSTPTLRFPASELFISCSTFPPEFSIVTTLKLTHTPQKSQYVFSVLSKDGVVLLALRLSAKGLQLVFRAHSGHGRLTVRGLRLENGRWHRLVLAVSGPHATLTLNCGAPLERELLSPFPENLSTENSWLYVGSRGKGKGIFLGVLQQLVLYPGSDVTLHVCPAHKPLFSDLTHSSSLSDVTGESSSSKAQQQQNFADLEPRTPGVPCRVLPSTGLLKAELRVTLGSTRVCSNLQQGNLRLDTSRRGLFLCDGSRWLSVLQEKQRLDYVDEQQNLYTSSEAQDMEVFRVEGVGLFAAVAHRSASVGSAVYRWNRGAFQLYQNISTSRAHSWTHFRIHNMVFLAVSNTEPLQSEQQEQSVIYKWSVKKRKFARYQTLHTHCARDLEAFHINNHTFLAVANHRTADGNHNVESVIYKWNPSSGSFEVFQTISTWGAYDWESFSVGQYHLLAVANAFDGSSTHIHSSIYVWSQGTFRLMQNIKTFGATDWEMFQIGSRVFLAVANGHMMQGYGQSVYAINSTIYELNTSTKSFLKFQDIVTYSAVDWEFFSLGEEHFLVVANSYDGSSYALNSVIYRWQGYEGFVPIHRLPTIGCSDWEFFSSSEGSYLMYSSGTTPLTKVFKLRTR